MNVGQRLSRPVRRGCICLCHESGPPDLHMGLGEKCPCKSSQPCRCSHIQDHHFIDRRGKTVCRSAACGCAEFRPGGTK